MKLFFQRLGVAAQAVLAIILAAALVIGMACIFMIFPVVQTILAVIIYGWGGLIIAVLIFGFIYWLFVEPFRKGRAK